MADPRWRMVLVPSCEINDITACLKIIKMLTKFLILSDTSLFIKYFSLYYHLEEFLDFANKFKTVT